MRKLGLLLAVAGAGYFAYLRLGAGAKGREDWINASG